MNERIAELEAMLVDMQCRYMELEGLVRQLDEDLREAHQQVSSHEKELTRVKLALQSLAERRFEQEEPW